MKTKIILLCFILLSGLVSAQQGGAGRYYCYNTNFCSGDYSICNQTTGNCELNMSSSTGCLVQNCDYFCRQFGMDSGEYYKENKCWCEKYQLTNRGEILKDSGWIEIEECIEKRYMSNQEIKDGLKEMFKIILIGLLISVVLWKSWGYIKKRKEK